MLLGLTDSAGVGVTHATWIKSPCNYLGNVVVSHGDGWCWYRAARILLVPSHVCSGHCSQVSPFSVPTEFTLAADPQILSQVSGLSV